MAEFRMRYPKDDPDEQRRGVYVTRRTRCKCAKEFTQNRINPEWLNSPSWGKELQKRFAEAFEVTANREVYIPKWCEKCSRPAQLEGNLRSL